MRRVAAGVVAGMVLTLGACSSGGPPKVAGSAPTATNPLEVRPAPSPGDPCAGTAPPDRWAHVVWIVMENRGLDQVGGHAPYLDQLAGQCGLAVNYSGVARPSLPNYIALTSGSTQAIHDDSGHALDAQSIFGLLGDDWRSLEEAMPVDCDRHSSGRYAVKHNPAVFYRPIAAECAVRDVPLADPPDLSAAFTLVTPDLCHDMHDCSTAAGDRWLSREVPLLLATAAYRAGTTALFVTWDESESGDPRVATYVVAPSVVPGTRSAEAFDHYSLLRTTEEMLRITPLLGHAAGASAMQGAFHLS